MENYEGPAEIYANGRLLAEAVRASVKTSGNNNRVVTMIKGLCGKSDGATSSDISIESAVPRRGLEFDFNVAVNTKAFFTIVIKGSGSRRQYKGWFEDCEETRAVDSAAALTANFIAGKPKILGS